MTIDFKTLAAPFPPDQIKWRADGKGHALAYIDARNVMNRLDTVCGPAGWQARYPHANGKTVCEIGIKIGDEWIWKSDGAGDTQISAEKGAISDAFKRAAVHWGIARYLYAIDTPKVATVGNKGWQIVDGEFPKLRAVAARAFNEAKSRDWADGFSGMILHMKSRAELENIQEQNRDKIDFLLKHFPAIHEQVTNAVTAHYQELSA